MRRLIILVAILSLLGPPAGAQGFTLPLKPNSVRFAVIGDMGTGSKQQYEVAQRMVDARQRFPYDFVIMVGDNIYGANGPSDMQKKFEIPYKPLLDSGVKFYAALGNHDDVNERFYEHFNMGGKQYYTFKQGNVRFFALDSNYMTPEQLSWLAQELKASGSQWKIPYFHHPLYSSGGRHGSTLELRKLLEPLFLTYKVQVVFQGHDHTYERVKPQGGIVYFVEGSSGQLRKGDLTQTSFKDSGFDTDQCFMLVEIAGDEMYFQTISRTGQTVDSGVIVRGDRQETATAAPQPAAKPAATTTEVVAPKPENGAPATTAVEEKPKPTTTVPPAAGTAPPAPTSSLGTKPVGDGGSQATTSAPVKTQPTGSVGTKATGDGGAQATAGGPAKSQPVSVAAKMKAAAQKVTATTKNVAHKVTTTAKKKTTHTAAVKKSKSKKTATVARTHKPRRYVLVAQPAS